MSIAIASEILMKINKTISCVERVWMGYSCIYTNFICELILQLCHLHLHRYLSLFIYYLFGSCVNFLAFQCISNSSELRKKSNNNIEIHLTKNFPLDGFIFLLFLLFLLSSHVLHVHSFIRIFERLSKSIISDGLRTHTAHIWSTETICWNSSTNSTTTTTKTKNERTKCTYAKQK